MTTIMRDSVNPSRIPAGTPVVGGYVDGLYGLGTNYWNAAAWARWAATGARLRRIAAVTVNTRSNTADVERYDLTPQQIPVWWRNMRGLGETDLWAYCDRADQHAVEDACGGAGIPVDQLSMWIATLDGTTVVNRYRYPIAAVQYIDRGPYDESLVYENYGDDSHHLEDDMLLTGPLHPLVKTLRAFVAGNAYRDPLNDSRVASGSIALGTMIAFTGYVYSSSPVSSSDLSSAPGAQPGPDSVWWVRQDGGYVPDAIIDTTALAGAPPPAAPAGEAFTVYERPGTGGGGPDDDSQYVTTAVYGSHKHINDAADPASAKTGPPV